jgi:hypothetical protein
MLICIVGCQNSPEIISQGETHAIYRTVFISTPECIAYDNALVSTIMQNWSHLLNEQTNLATYSGKVEIKFELYYDGSIQKLKVARSNMGDIFMQICITAINEQNPFQKWPDSMYGLVKANYRQIALTFSFPDKRVLQDK